MDTIDNKFHGFVEVLNTLGTVDEHVRSVDILDRLCFFLVHTECNECVTACDVVHVHGNFVCLDCIEDVLRHRLNREEESVVSVRGLSFNSTVECLCDGLTVNNDWRRGNDVDTFVSLDTSGNDFKVKFTHTCNEVFSGLFVDVDTDCRVFLTDLVENFDEFRQVFGVLCFDCDGHNRLRVVLERLERSHFL